MLCDVLDGDRVLQVQAVRLSLQSCLVDEDPGIGVQAGEGEADVGVDEADLGGGDAGILQLHGRTLLTAKNDNVLALDSNCACSCCSTIVSLGRLAASNTMHNALANAGEEGRTSLDGFASVFDLEDVSIGTTMCKYANLQYARIWEANLKTAWEVELAKGSNYHEHLQLVGCLPERARSYPEAMMPVF